MYRNVKILAEETGISIEEARKKIKRMKLSLAYPHEVFLVKPIRVDYDAFIHFNTYEELITKGKPFPEWRTA